MEIRYTFAFIDNHNIIAVTIDISIPKVIIKPFSYLDFNAVDKYLK